MGGSHQHPPPGSHGGEWAAGPGRGLRGPAQPRSRRTSQSGSMSSFCSQPRARLHPEDTGRETRSPEGYRWPRLAQSKGPGAHQTISKAQPGLPSCEASPQEQMGLRKQVQTGVSPGAVASALVPWTEDRLDCLCHLQVQCGEGRKLFVYNYTLFLEFAIPIIV